MRRGAAVRARVRGQARGAERLGRAADVSEVLRRQGGARRGVDARDLASRPGNGSCCCSGRWPKQAGALLMNKTRIFCSAAAVAGLASAAMFYGCTPQGGSSNDPVAAGAGSSNDASLNVQVTLVDAKGSAQANNTFANKSDVW